MPQTVNLMKGRGLLGGYRGAATLGGSGGGGVISANGVEDFRQKTPKNIVEIAKILIDAGAAVNAESDAYAGRSTALGLTATSWPP